MGDNDKLKVTHSCPKDILFVCELLCHDCGSVKMSNTCLIFTLQLGYNHKAVSKMVVVELVYIIFIFSNHRERSSFKIVLELSRFPVVSHLRAVHVTNGGVLCVPLRQREKIHLCLPSYVEELFNSDRLAWFC